MHGSTHESGIYRIDGLGDPSSTYEERKHFRARLLITLIQVLAIAQFRAMDWATQQRAIASPTDHLIRLLFVEETDAGMELEHRAALVQARAGFYRYGPDGVGPYTIFQESGRMWRLGQAAMEEVRPYLLPRRVYRQSRVEEQIRATANQLAELLATTADDGALGRFASAADLRRNPFRSGAIHPSDAQEIVRLLNQRTRLLEPVSWASQEGILTDEIELLLFWTQFTLLSDERYAGRFPVSTETRLVRLCAIAR